MEDKKCLVTPVLVSERKQPQTSSACSLCNKSSFVYDTDSDLHRYRNCSYFAFRHP